MNVSVEFDINGDGVAEKKEFILQLPHDINKVSEEAGRHDHGSLPAMKSDGHYAILVNSLLQAKAHCDGILTTAITIETEAGATAGGSGGGGIPEKKKPRIAADDDDDEVMEE